MRRISKRNCSLSSLAWLSNSRLALQKTLNMSDHNLCRRTLTIAKRSFLQGNLPFGCLLADANGNILLEAENSVITSKDAIAHCEINLVHAFAGKYDFEFLNTCTVYASTEPCPMCSGAIFFSGVGRIVYALSKERYKEIANDHNPAYHFPVSSKELLSKGGRQVHVEGPALEQEAIEFYASLFIKS